MEERLSSKYDTLEGRLSDKYAGLATLFRTQLNNVAPPSLRHASNAATLHFADGTLDSSQRFTAPGTTRVIVDCVTCVHLRYPFGPFVQVLCTTRYGHARIGVSSRALAGFSPSYVSVVTPPHTRAHAHQALTQ